MRIFMSLLAFLSLAAAVCAEDSGEGTQSMRRIDLSEARQVEQGIHHWSGPRDGSAQVVIKREESFLNITGTLLDDRPFLQLWPIEILAATAEHNLPGDGLRFQFYDPESDTADPWCDFVMTFGSHATDPQVRVFQSPEKKKPYAIKGSKFKYTLRDGRIFFEAKIPAKSLLPESAPSFDRSAIEVWLYDLDGENRLYTILRDTIPAPIQKQSDQSN